MEKNYIGRLMVRVTVNGCGMPLYGAKINVDGKNHIIPLDRDGFSEIIEIFTFEEKGCKRYCTVKAEYEGFAPVVCDNIPVNSGYLTVWNIPLSPIKAGVIKKP